MKYKRNFFRNLKALFSNKEDCTNVFMVTNNYKLDENKRPIDMKVYTITSTLDSCIEYMDCLLKLDNKEHYELWCENHNFEINKESWDNYKENVIGTSQDDKYLIGKYTYPMTYISTILRMHNRCQPLGCSYEDKKEYDYYLKGIVEDKIRETLTQMDSMNEEEVQKELEEELEQIQEELKQQEDNFKSTC